MGDGSGRKMADMGCCLGQDLRKLVLDGIPPENLVGVELQPEFIELGYDLFRDRDRRPPEGGNITWLVGDLLAPVGTNPWPGLHRRFDIVNFSMVLHQFTRDQQIVMFERAIHVLEDRPGTIITGTACGSPDGRVVTWAGREIPNHNAETFGRLIHEVEERTGTKWKVEAEIDNCVSMYDGKRSWVGPHLKRLMFEMTRLA